MAYSFNVAYSRTYDIAGVRHHAFVIDELEATLTSEWYIDGMPTIGTITRFNSAKSSGSAVNLANGLFAATGGAVELVQYSSQTSASEAVPVPYMLINGDTLAKNRIYGRSGADAGSNNTIRTSVVIVEGHRS